MSRPKGSKNKKTLAKRDSLAQRLEAMIAEHGALVSDQKAQEETIAETQAKLKETKKAIRKLETQIKRLKEQKEEADLAAANASKKQMALDKISELIDGGKDADEILSALNGI